MDNITKAIARLDRKTAQKLIVAMEKIQRGDFAQLDIKKLRGHKDIFKVRVGNYRIIYRQSDEIRILFIGHRNERLYKNL